MRSWKKYLPMALLLAGCAGQPMPKLDPEKAAKALEAAAEAAKAAQEAVEAVKDAMPEEPASD